MKYTVENGVHIVSCVPSEFSIHMVSQNKKTCAYKTYANGGFFWGFTKDKQWATYPLTHLKCDVDNINAATRSVVSEMGTFDGTKFTYDNGLKCNSEQFLGKSISTFWIKGNNFGVDDCKTLPVCDYAIGGVPVIRDGNDVTFATYVKGQGWNGQELRATYHTFIGLKGDGKIYLMAWQSKTSNLIYGMEAYKVFRPMGFTDLIKLDGGGSQIFTVEGKVKMQHSESRAINNIIVITPQVVTAPTTVSTVAKTAWEKAAAKGLLDGTRPKDALTREELAIVLDRLGVL